MFASLLPVLIALAVLGLLGIGAVFGAWITESDTKRRQRHAARPLMPVIDAGDAVTVGPVELLPAR